MAFHPPERQRQVLLDQLDLTRLTGLSQLEATQRLVQEGYNELPTSRRRQFFVLLLEILREPMFLLLIAGGVIYLLLGDVREALVLLGSIFVIIGITFYQEQRSEMPDGHSATVPGLSTAPAVVLAVIIIDNFPWQIRSSPSSSASRGYTRREAKMKTLVYEG